MLSFEDYLLKSLSTTVQKKDNIFFLISQKKDNLQKIKILQQLSQDTIKDFHHKRDIT